MRRRSRCRRHAHGRDRRMPLLRTRATFLYLVDLMVARIATKRDETYRPRAFSPNGYFSNDEGRGMKQRCMATYKYCFFWGVRIPLIMRFHLVVSRPGGCEKSWGRVFRLASLGFWLVVSGCEADTVYAHYDRERISTSLTSRRS